MCELSISIALTKFVNFVMFISTVETLGVYVR
jgi:hypothetical protein